MEQQDWNMIGANVLSCCCQCLMLQLVVFVLLKPPTKLVKKTKLYIKRKLGNKIRNGVKMVRKKVAQCVEDVVRCQKLRDSMMVRSRAQSFRLERFDGCMEEVEELSTSGGFGFESFWRRDDGVKVHFPICLVNQELGCHDHVFDPFRLH